MTIKGTKWRSESTTMQGQELPAGALQLQFQSDGKLVYRIGSHTFTGTYTLGVGNEVTLQLDQELAGRKTHKQRMILNDDHLTVVDSDETRLKFSKSE